MDTFSNTDFTSFLDFCKSLDTGVVHTPEQALELYRSRRDKNNGGNRSTDLGQDLLGLREQIVASGAPLLSADELDRELASRRGEPLSQE